MDSSDLSPASTREVQRLRELARDPSRRRESGSFLIEGVTVALEALTRPSDVVGLAVDLDALGRPEIAALVEQARASRVEVKGLSPVQLERIATTVTPQRAVAEVTLPATSLAELIDAARTAYVLVLAGVSDPGNAGTLLRSAEAFGAGGVIFCAGSVDAFNTKTVRASAGAVLRVPLVSDPTLDAREVMRALGSAGVRRVGAVPRDGRPPAEASLGTSCAIVLGNEAHGLAPEVALMLDDQVTLPMAPSVESLNVGIAGSILCYEARRSQGANLLVRG